MSDLHSISCYYCSTELEHHGGGFFKCFTCPYLVTYICWGSMAKIHIRSVDIVCDPYVIALGQDTMRCNLYYKCADGTGSLETILSLNYLPEITPHNVTQWIERLLKLKAFS